ncbi:MAG: hypothetical protein E7455_07650 [Ruminococcaceae bacterium]|nr:hypothetical protein [Oscillospiraceae bacterium]
MKKLLALLLAISMLLCLAACSSDAPSSVDDKKDNQENCAETGKHTLGDWTLYAEATNFTPKETRRSCSGCKYYEYERDYTQMADHYFNVVETLDVWFGQQNDDYTSHLVYWALLQGVEYTLEEEGEICIISVANLDELTMQYFGKTFDYTGLYNDLIYGRTRCVYDETRNALSLFSFDDFTGPEVLKSEVLTCDGDDDRRIVVTGRRTQEDDMGNPVYWSDYEMIIELIGDQYVITSYAMVQ